MFEKESRGRIAGKTDGLSGLLWWCVPTWPNAPTRFRTSLIPARVPSFAPRSRSGDSRAAAVTRSVQAEAVAVASETARPSILGGLTFALGPLARRLDPRRAGYGGWLASRRLSALLAGAFARLSLRPPDGRHRCPRSPRTHGERESVLGRAQDSRRVIEARLRCFRTHRLPLPGADGRPS